MHLVRKIDREQLPVSQNLTFIVEAVDRKLKTGQLIVLISITDINDNFPQFEKLQYSVSVAENVNVPMPLVKVKASDRDGTEILYEMISNNEQTKIESIFHIDNKTCLLYTSPSPRD